MTGEFLLVFDGICSDRGMNFLTHGDLEHIIKYLILQFIEIDIKFIRLSLYQKVTDLTDHIKSPNTFLL